MNRYEFIQELKAELSGNVPAKVIAENEAFYQKYIEDEVRNGRSEAEVLEELGSPRLIANTIIETTAPEEESYTEYTDYSENEEQSANPLKLFQFSGWWLLLIPLLVIILVISLVAHIVSLIPGVFIWIFLGVLLYKWMRRR